MEMFYSQNNNVPLSSANLVFSTLVTDLKTKPSVHPVIAFMLHTKMSRDVTLMIFAKVKMESTSHNLIAFEISHNPLFAFFRWYQVTSGFHVTTLKEFKYLIATLIIFNQLKYVS